MALQKSTHDNPLHMAGTIKKSSGSSGYRESIKKVVGAQHPIKHGVVMQVHHLISKTAATPFAQKVEAYGYDINWLSNLANIPSTLAGACHLGVQPHISDHKIKVSLGKMVTAFKSATGLSDTSGISDTEEDVDTDRVADYHDFVKNQLRLNFRKMEQHCSTELTNRIKLRNKLDKLSKMLAHKLNEQPDTFKLTAVAAYYTHNNPVGCGGKATVKALLATQGAVPCPCERNHQADGINYDTQKHPFSIAAGQ